MAELFGKITGANAGKSGNQGLHHPAGHFWGIYPICAAQTPIAAGLAFQMKYQNTGGMAFCMLGEGSVNQGIFHETLNLSQLFFTGFVDAIALEVLQAAFVAIPDACGVQFYGWFLAHFAAFV